MTNHLPIASPQPDAPMPAAPAFSVLTEDDTLPTGESDSLDGLLATLQATRTKLLVREAQLSQAQQMAGLASWEWYFGGTKIKWSPEMYHFWGYAPGEIEVSLDSVAKTTHLEDLPILQQAIEKALRGEDLDIEYRRYNRQGHEVFIHTIGRIVYSPAGAAIGVFGIDRNITRQQQQAQELADLNQALLQKNSELERRNAELASFSYVASHDLQEPIRKIQTFNGLVLQNESAQLSDKGRDYLKRSTAAASRMQALIKGILTYSRTNDTSSAFQLVNLDTMLEGILVELAETIEVTQATIDVSPLPVVLAIEFQMQQLLENLLGNALKYTKPGVPPHIRLDYAVMPGEQLAENRTGDYHRLTVTDNGIGFNETHREKIFQLFQRLHHQNVYEGTGIGLTICRKVAENHQGYITADSIPGQGTTFSVYWPVRLG